MKRLFQLSAVLLAILMASCATQTVTLRDGATATTQEERQQFFINGLGQEQKRDAAALCGGADRVATIQVYRSFMDGVLSAITLGIYSPAQAKISCL